MAEWLLPLAAVVGSAIGVILTFLGARRLGLTDLQKAVNLETDKLVSRLRDRVSVLEAENERLMTQIASLSTDALTMRKRIDDLEAALADAAVSRRRTVHK